MILKKKVGAALSAGLLTLGLGAVASAATWDDYDTSVPIVNDYESKPITKTTTGSAYNDVSRIDNGTLVSWVENSGGSNITGKVTYTSTGRKTMDYSNASTHKGDKLHLNISTSIGTWSSVYTKGEWTPN